MGELKEVLEHVTVTCADRDAGGREVAVRPCTCPPKRQQRRWYNSPVCAILLKEESEPSFEKKNVYNTPCMVSNGRELRQHVIVTRDSSVLNTSV